MSRLSIILPFVGNAKRLEDTLVSVLANRPEDCEVLVILGQPYDDPYDLGDEVSFLEAPARSSLIRAINQGVDAARSPIVHVLTCGAEVSEGWADAALSHFDDPRVAAVAPLIVNLRGRDRVVAAGMEYCRNGTVRFREQGRRPILVGREPKDVPAPHPAAAFFRKSALESAGQLATAVGDRWAMLDISLTLTHLGLRTVLDPQCRVAVSPSEGSAGAFRAAMEAERFYWRWASTPGWTGALAPHALHVAAHTMQGIGNLSIFARLAGRFVGFCRGGAARRQPEHLHPAGTPGNPAAPNVRNTHPRNNGSPATANGLGQPGHGKALAGAPTAGELRT